MAKPWIKLEEDTPDKIEVMRLRNMLGKDAVMDYVLRFWSWVTKNSFDGNIHGVTLEDIDSIAKCPGLAEGLVKVGWLEGREGRFSIPHFDRHLSQSALAKADANQRVTKCRKLKQKSVTKCNENETKMLHQKRKEKNNIKVSGNTAVDDGADAEPRARFLEWVGVMCGCVPSFELYDRLFPDAEEAAEQAFGCMPRAVEHAALLKAYYADRLKEDRRGKAFWRPEGAQFFRELGDVLQHAERWKRETGWKDAARRNEDAPRTACKDSGGQRQRKVDEELLEAYRKAVDERYKIAEGGEV